MTNAPEPLSHSLTALQVFDVRQPIQKLEQVVLWMALRFEKSAVRFDLEIAGCPHVVHPPPSVSHLGP